MAPSLQDKTLRYGVTDPAGTLTVTYPFQNVGSSDCTTTIQVAWTGTKPGFGSTIVIGYAPISQNNQIGAQVIPLSTSADPHTTLL